MSRRRSPASAGREGCDSGLSALRGVEPPLQLGLAHFGGLKLGAQPLKFVASVVQGGVRVVQFGLGVGQLAAQCGLGFVEAATPRRQYCQSITHSISQPMMIPATSAMPTSILVLLVRGSGPVGEPRLAIGEVCGWQALGTRARAGRTWLSTVTRSTLSVDNFDDFV